jgi:hypothetical protein
LAFLLIGTAPWWVHPQPDWINQQEDRWLSKVVPTLPAEARVLYPDPQRRTDKFREIQEMSGMARWSGGGTGGNLLYVGVGCLLPEAQECREIQKKCRLTPKLTQEFPALSDQDLDLGGAETVTLGFYEMACP